MPLFQRKPVAVTLADGRQLPLRPGQSLLQAILAAGLPHRHSCGGRALCGTCRVRILATERPLPRPRGRERQRLKELGAPPDQRLACQLAPRRNVTVEAVLPPDDS